MEGTEIVNVNINQGGDEQSVNSVIMQDNNDQDNQIIDKEKINSVAPQSIIQKSDNIQQPVNVGVANMVDVTEQLQNDNQTKFTNPKIIKKIQDDTNQMMIGQTGQLIRKNLHTTQAGCCGLKQNQVLKDFYSTPTVNIFSDVKEKKFINVRKIDYTDKAVHIVYNPASGKKRDTRTKIQTFCKEKGINCEFYESKGRLDALKYVMTFDTSNCAAVLLVGGDGTAHEGINGMMRRPKETRVPIAIMPNGSGDDTAGCFGMEYNAIDTALQYVQKGHVIKVDINKVLIDHDNEDDIQATVDKLGGESKIEDYLRYMIINSSLCLSADVGKNAQSMKDRGWGPHAYTIQTVIELTKRKTETFDIWVDKDSYSKEDDVKTEAVEGAQDSDMQCIAKGQVSQLLMVYSAKYGGGRIILNPHGLINDGLFELMYLKNLVGFGPISKLFEGSKKGGIQVYDNALEIMRLKKLKLVNRSSAINKETGIEETTPQNINIDGEDLTFKTSVSYQNLHEELEIVVDFQAMIDKFYQKKI